MKKNIYFILIVLCLICCSCNKSKNNNDNEINRNNSTVNKISNSNSNTNTNSLNKDSNNSSSKEKKDYDESKVGNNEVTLYLFYSSTCPHCHSEIEWLDSIKDKYKYLKIVKLEASKNTELYESVVEKMKVNSYGVPLNVIGSEFNVGYSESKSNELINLIEKYSTYKHCDAVDTIKNNGDLEKCINSNKK